MKTFFLSLLCTVIAIAKDKEPAAPPDPRIDPIHLINYYRDQLAAQPLNIAIEQDRTLIFKDCDVPGWEVFEPPKGMAECRKKIVPPVVPSRPKPTAEPQAKEAPTSTPPAASQPKP